MEDFIIAMLDVFINFNGRLAQDCHEIAHSGMGTLDTVVIRQPAPFPKMIKEKERE